MSEALSYAGDITSNFLDDLSRDISDRLDDAKEEASDRVDDAAEGVHDWVDDHRIRDDEDEGLALAQVSAVPQTTSQGPGAIFYGSLGLSLAAVAGVAYIVAQDRKAKASKLQESLLSEYSSECKL